MEIRRTEATEVAGEVAEEVAGRDGTHPHMSVGVASVGVAALLPEVVQLILDQDSNRSSGDRYVI
jgi:hypothetical protein